MFKLVVLTKRKAGMSMEAFMDYYENNHAPLMMSFYPQVKKYTRTYLHSVSHETLTGDEDKPVDCVTEAFFEDEAGWLDVIR
ncbi:MAG: EthD family reductase, partial [Rhizobiaceae bacterium]